MEAEKQADARRITRLIDRLARVTRELQFSGGLNPAQWEALRFLANANRVSRTPGGLANFLGTTKGTASQTLISLEGKGLVSRVRSDSDRRVVVLELTEDGHRTLDRDPMLTVAGTIQELPPDAGEKLENGLSDLLNRLCAELGMKTFGPCSECHSLKLLITEQEAKPDPMCGKTDEAIAETDASCLCINHQPTAAN